MRGVTTGPHGTERQGIVKFVDCRLSLSRIDGGRIGLQAFQAGTPGNEFWVIHVYGTAYEVGDGRLWLWRFVEVAVVWCAVVM